MCGNDVSCLKKLAMIDKTGLNSTGSIVVAPHHLDNNCIVDQQHLSIVEKNVKQL